jgi:hypothetical protein
MTNSKEFPWEKSKVWSLCSDPLHTWNLISQAKYLIGAITDNLSITKKLQQTHWQHFCLTEANNYSILQKDSYVNTYEIKAFHENDLTSILQPKRNFHANRSFFCGAGDWTWGLVNTRQVLLLPTELPSRTPCNQTIAMKF